MIKLENPNFPNATVIIDQSNDQIRFTMKTAEGAEKIRIIEKAKREKSKENH
jgi:hypothetical protein